MTYDNFIQLVKQPEKIAESNQEQLKELIAEYPYFGIAKWLYLKALHKSNSVYFNQELKKTALYSYNRRDLYFFIHPEEITVKEASIRERNALSGSYFDMANILEGKETDGSKRSSLQSLAERLRAARELLHTTKKDDRKIEETVELTDDKSDQEIPIQNEPDFDLYELEAKKFIKEKKYEEAIAILEKLNLINPKKSIYFADQIRYLRRITKI